MNVRLTVVRSACVALAAGVFAFAAAFWPRELHAGEGGGRFHICYFDEARPLTLDTSRIAVRLHDAAEAQAGWLAAAGLRVEDLASHAIAPWRLATLPENNRSEAAVRETLSRLAAAAEADGFVSPVFVDDLGGPLIVTPQVLVQFRESVAPDRARAVLTERWLEVLDADWANMPGAYRAASASRSGLEVLAQANDLARLPETVYAEPDMIFSDRGDDLPNDPLFLNQWGLHNAGQFITGCSGSGAGALTGFDVGALGAWQVTEGDPDIFVVILDTGVQQNHPDIHQVPGADFTSQGPGDGGPLNECDNHGTAVAGVVSAVANNGIGVAGVAPAVRIASARTAISNVPCSGGSSQASNYVNALDWAQQIGARVTNTSRSLGFTSAAMANKYAQTQQGGIIHFGSAGNNANANLSYPASLPTVHAIVGLGKNGVLWPPSNFGPGIAFAAPGGQIFTTDRTAPDGYNIADDYTCRSGTSYASPMAAGVAALILSINPSLSAFDVEQIMIDTAVDLGAPGYDTTYGWGMVHAATAVGYEPPLPEPPNNTCQSSHIVEAGLTPFTNMGATTDGPDEPDLCNFSGDATIQSDVWFRHTAQCTGDLTISLCQDDGGSADFESKVAVYSAACPSAPGSALACNKDACGEQSSVTIAVTQGQVYRIRVGGHHGAQGDGVLSISCTVPEPPKCPADVTGTGEVNIFDLLQVLSSWGECAGCPEDVTTDGFVNIFDLLFVLANWGPCPQ